MGRWAAQRWRLLSAEPTVESDPAEARPRPPPVFLITHEFYPRHGGIATFVEEMARAGANLGHEIEVWAQALPPGATEKTWPFRLHRLPLRGTHDVGCLLRQVRELIVHRRRLHHATVYLAEPGPIRAMMALQFFPGFRTQRLVLTFYGSEILRFHRNPMTRWLTRRLIRQASRVSVLTDYTQRLLCSRFPEAASKILLTPGAVRSGCSAGPSDPDRNPADRVIIMTVGRLHPRKGQLFIIEALQALPVELRSRVEYRLVGGNSKEHYEARLRSAAAASDLEVKFTGDIPDEELDRLYKQADIFAMTSIEHRDSVEGFGLVYLDAAAHGLPVVAHRVGGVPEAVLDGETGLLVAPGDRAALTAALARLIADPDLRGRLGAAGRTWARRNNWLRSAELLFNGADRGGNR